MIYIIFTVLSLQLAFVAYLIGRDSGRSKGEIRGYVEGVDFMIGCTNELFEAIFQNYGIELPRMKTLTELEKEKQSHGSKH